ncbi:pyruvate dehydrogenase E1 component subunit alpha, mitochondrial-like [Anopheles darlingi]|uniref:pyruvate dehydrogenase E1 component subunit alpha, mitochondrial-like n=1 Tax=Anopheles darlingi TaxID=43151 RepID=UPI00210056CF|nr:pyruvate dehydrogenase E1 component subunit alpha, mitochondrial-like [Anopheles darlingi]
MIKTGLTLAPRLLRRQQQQTTAVVASSIGSGSVTVKNYATEAKFETKPFKLHNLTEGPPTKATVTRDEALQYYRQMQTIRRLETSAGNLYKEKLVRGFCHLYSGQEACAVGMKAAMRTQDNIISAYRVHGWTYLMGITPSGVLSELTGKSGGCARGKGGSMHMYAKNFYGGNGIVGAQVPLGAGVALACKYKNNGGVCLALYGDGASNQGQIFEAYNMAHLWKLPCIFVCENNGYGMGTSADRGSCNVNFYSRGDVLPGIWVDGMDVVAVKLATEFAINHVLNIGPVVMEVYTYRYSGHSMSDPGTSYRTREEVQEVRQTRDPITSFKDKIIDAGLVKAEELKTMDNEIKKEIDDATKQAKADSEIGLPELSTDVYSNNLEGEIRGCTPASWLKHSTLKRAVNL